MTMWARHPDPALQGRGRRRRHRQLAELLRPERHRPVDDPVLRRPVYDDPAVYATSSPIDFIKQVKTPTLILVGERDVECPAPQSFEFWHALQTRWASPTALVVYRARATVREAGAPARRARARARVVRTST